MSLLYGGIEAGGTKFVCAVGTGPGHLIAETRFPTTEAAENFPQAIEFFREQQARHGRLDALGIGSFGPVDPDPASPTWGYITLSPKPGWHMVDFAGTVQRALELPVGFDTDVNAAALGEWRWGAAQGLDTFVYLTVGTGIGGGVLANGRLLHGLLHPELGHMRIAHDRQADPYAGFCPYHGDCLEGLAAGPALEARWGQRGETLPAGHPAWALEAHYLAQGLANCILVLSPQRLILGGGVMQQPQLFPLVRREVQALLNEYVETPALRAGIDDYICPPGLGTRSGVLGALALAEQAATNPK
jgi:fructokinase